MRRKNVIALAMAVITGMTSVSLPVDTVKAEEVAQEYVVLAKNDAGYEKIEENYGDEMTTESVDSEVLEENNIAVVELTETEAENLEDDKNILIVEEDIVLEASEGKKKNNKKADKEKKAYQEKKKQKAKKWEEIERMEEEAIAEAETEVEWNLQAINVEEVVENTEVAQQKIKVAIIDSGVDYVSGIDLAGYANFVDTEDEISVIFQDMTGHGTGIASVIAENGEKGLDILQIILQYVK
ncbi:MAG: hypothetical protein J6A75_09815 [Lachnospiraceae bacterium]|nr:hypothetical protein [Lachnospiraceae bacterium]